MFKQTDKKNPPLPTTNERRVQEEEYRKEKEQKEKEGERLSKRRKGWGGNTSIYTLKN